MSNFSCIFRMIEIIEERREKKTVGLNVSCVAKRRVNSCPPPHPHHFTAGKDVTVKRKMKNNFKLKKKKKIIYKHEWKFPAKNLLTYDLMF